MTIKILDLEKVNPADWTTLWKAYLKFYQTELSDSQIQSTWQRLTDAKRADMFGYALSFNDQIVGFVHLIAHSSTWTDLPYCYLQDLFVHEDVRNQGFARKLIEHSYDVCAGQFDRVYWLTHESNQTAQLLYNRIANQTGFIQYKKSLS